MKNKLFLYYKKIKFFLTKKRKFPMTINLNIIPFLSKNEIVLRNQICSLSHNNKILRKEIKKLKTIIEIRNMEISLDKKGDY